MKRTGLSLLEVIVALGVLVGSAAVLAQMIDLGARHALRARNISDAQRVAANVLHELLAGLRPLQEVTPQPLQFDSPWLYAIHLAPGPAETIIDVTVSVWPAPQASGARTGGTTASTEQAAPMPVELSATASSSGPRPAISLRRWVYLPASDQPADSADPWPIGQESPP